METLLHSFFSESLANSGKLFSGYFRRDAQPAALSFAHEMRSTRNGTKDVDCGAAATATATSTFLRYAWRGRRRDGKSSARATISGRWVVGGVSARAIE